MNLKQLHPNEGQIPGVPANPRTITEDDFKKLKKSLKSFHKMMRIRPIVVDEDFNILGGNMRYQALKALAKEGATTEIYDKNGAVAGYYKFDQEIPDDWVHQETDLTPDEKMEFIVKDNQERGQWDYDKLANEWDAKKMKKWDVPVANWDADNLPPMVTNQVPGDEPEYTPGGGTLPPELEGLDLNPNELPKLQGDDETAYERVIITFRKEQKVLLEGILGIENLDKVLISLDEILEMQI